MALHVIGRVRNKGEMKREGEMRGGEIKRMRGEREVEKSKRGRKT